MGISTGTLIGQLIVLLVMFGTFLLLLAAVVSIVRSLRRGADALERIAVAAERDRPANDRGPAASRPD